MRVQEKLKTLTSTASQIYIILILNAFVFLFRISDLGLACDFSKKKPHASVGTHGYMAPEVLSKGTAYDSSADWFSFGCMLYKLLKGHSPFRQHKTKDKHEIDRMTLTMNVELPESFTDGLRQLLEGLLQVSLELEIA